MDIHADLFFSYTGYDVTPATSGLHIEVRKMAENAASDGIVSNFCGAAFCLAQPIGGLLVKEI